MELSIEITNFILMLIIACAVGVVVKFVRFPYTIALVLVGLFVGITKIIPEIPLTKDLVFLLILPPLLFEASLNMDLEHFKENFKSISLLAIFGVLISTIVVGFLIHFALRLPLEISLLFGAMISPTDPVSVLATFRVLNAPKKLSTILEGESIINDGTGVVVFGILLEMIESGRFDVFNGIATFLFVCIGGALIGLSLGYLAYRFLAFIDDHLIEITITLVLAYSCFLIAEHFHLSGVIAVVCAGLIIGNYGTLFSMSPSTRVTLLDFWGFIVFIINSIVFLLIGVDTHLGIFRDWYAILIAVFAVLLARALVVYPLKIPWSWKHIVFWGGLHGTIPVALALSLGDIPYRDLLANMTFGVVIFSLVFQGVTLEIFVKRIFRKDRKFEEILAKLIASKNALNEIRKLSEEGKITENMAEMIENELKEEISKLNRELEEILEKDREASKEMLRRVHKNVLNAKKSAVKDAVIRGLISEETGAKILRELDSIMEEEF